MNLHFAAISRGKRYSPNHITNDARILQLTIEELEKQGHSVTVYDEDEIRPDLIDTPYIFNMIRGTRSLGVLQELEANGALVINSTEAILNCYRKNLATLLPPANIPIPSSIVIDTYMPLPEIPFASNPFKVWIKRGDVHAIHREDVTTVYSIEELNEIILEYRQRGIHSAVIQQHVDGPVIKFYAVRNTPFFHWYFHDSTFTMQINEIKLKYLAAKCAETLKVDVYGGDAIVSPDGKIQIIDLNDWPSFAPVRDEAAKYIAQVIINKAYSHYVELNLHSFPSI